MARNEIFVGFGRSFPPVDENGNPTRGEWERERVYIIPMIKGISEMLWKKIWNTTNDAHPIYGKDGSAVYFDEEGWQVVRVMTNGETVKIADVTAYC